MKCKGLVPMMLTSEGKKLIGEFDMESKVFYAERSVKSPREIEDYMLQKGIDVLSMIPQASKVVLNGVVL